ncbi:protein kinase [Streptomyces sp. NPDC059142]|uniref:protein kinase domain-containing protein n=1 Tax=Streptomyces sp. NPDC059142 TaxID=3346739 RepID=UPI00367AEAAC
MAGVTGPIRTGVTLAGGRYRIEEQVGQGGMAAVHKAHDTALDRTVAVKSMLAALAYDERCRARFRREAQAVAGLSHPCVVAVHDTGEERFEDGRTAPYLVMEFVRGETLSALLARSSATGGGLPLDRALELTAEVLSALTASHAAGIVHRDIKPSNVIVTDAGALKVMDFGIARALDVSGPERTALTATGMTPGTPQYMSPEQFEGRRPVDGRSDLYAVGVVLFQLITGELPFDGDSFISLGYLHVTTAAPTLASAGVPVPAGVEALVARALEKNPDDRFQDAHEMRARIEYLRERVHGAATITAAARPAPRPPAAVATPHPVLPPLPPTPPPTPPSPSPVAAHAYRSGPGRPPAHGVRAVPDPVRAPADNKARAARLRRAYGLLAPAVMLQAFPGSLSLIPLICCGFGVWLSARGGSSPVGQRRSVPLAVFQATAFIPLLAHVLLGLVSAAQLFKAVP